MRMNYLKLILLFSPLVSAQMNITTVERVQTVLKPDVLRGHIGFEAQSKNQTLIKERFNTIISEVKRFDPKAKMCQGGGYYVIPQYSYKDQTREYLGYSANLNFDCEFNTIDAYNELSAALEKATAVDVRKNQGALSWNVSDTRQNEVHGSLRLELLRKARDQAKAFSEETKMECRVSHVNFTNVSRPIPIMAKGMNMMASTPTESPIQTDETLHLEATVDYTCTERKP